MHGGWKRRQHGLTDVAALWPGTPGLLHCISPPSDLTEAREAIPDYLCIVDHTRAAAFLIGRNFRIHQCIPRRSVVSLIQQF